MGALMWHQDLKQHGKPCRRRDIAMLLLYDKQQMKRQLLPAFSQTWDCLL